MNHNELFKKYKEIFQANDADIDVWFPNGKDSVRVRYKDKREFVFTYSKSDEWCIQTIKEFLKSTRKK